MHKETEVAPQDGDSFAVARFACNISQDEKKPKGVIVMVPGSNGDGRQDIYDLNWTTFARRHRLALVGCQFIDREASWVEQYIEAKRGSGAALLTALKDFGLEGLPLYLWGFSAGGEFNYEFACWAAPKFPGLIKAFIVNKGGVYLTCLAPPETRDIPAIFFSGVRDASFRKKVLSGIFALNMQAGCLWEEDMEDVSHQIGHSEERAMKLFASYVRWSRV